MSLLNNILSALDNPNQEANTNQLAGIFNTVQQLSNTAGMNPDAMQSALGIAGKYVRSSLQEKRANQGDMQAQQLVNQFGGTQPNAQILNLLFNAPQLQAMVQEISNRTGLNASTIQSLLPTLIPLVLGLLKSGNQVQSAPGTGNPVLSGFLDLDGDGDVDMMDAMQMASRYIR